MMEYQAQRAPEDAAVSRQYEAKQEKKGDHLKSTSVLQKLSLCEAFPQPSDLASSSPEVAYADCDIHPPGSQNVGDHHRSSQTLTAHFLLLPPLFRVPQNPRS